MAHKPIPRPSCPAMYTKYPPAGSSLMRAMAELNCGPHSQRWEPKTSPVRQFECTRTNGLSLGSPTTKTLFTAKGETRWENKCWPPRALKSAARASTCLSTVLRTAAYHCTVVSTPGKFNGSGIGPSKLIASSPGDSGVATLIS